MFYQLSLSISSIFRMQKILYTCNSDKIHFDYNVIRQVHQMQLYLLTNVLNEIISKSK